MSLRISTKVAIVILKTILALSIILGLLPVRYNFTKKTLESSRIALIYSILIYVSAFTVVVLELPTVKAKTANVGFFNDNPVNGIINAIQVAFGATVYVVTLYGSWTKRQQIIHIFNEIKSIYLDYFERYNFLIRRNIFFDRFVLVQGFLTILQIVLCWYGNISFISVFAIDFFPLPMLIAIFHSVVYIIKNHFNYTSLFVCICFKELNKDMESLAELLELELARSDGSILSSNLQFNRCSAELAATIHHVRLIYHRLLLLSQRIVKCYQLQVSLLIVFAVSANIVHTFFFILFKKNKFWHYNFLISLLFPMKVLSNLLEFSLTITVCENAINAASYTPQILKRFDAHNSLDESTVRSLETFSLYCSNNKLRFRMCGLYDLDHKAGHNLMETIAFYLIFLVQLDYMNL